MGKGGRSHSRKYRIVKHSAEYYKKQRELKHRREQAKAIQNGDIFTGKTMILPLILPSHSLTSLLNKKDVKP